MTKANTETPTGLALLRVPFDKKHISKLPKPTISNEEWKKLPKAKCEECGGYHAVRNTIHLDYVGHAALTDRLLDADPSWTWEPVAMGEDGQPKLDSNGGMWIKLTVCGVTRLGYGDAQGKTGGNAVKERIGDALRNAAMRFGAALDLWHKGDLHSEEDAGGKDDPKVESDVAKQIVKANVTPNADAGADLTPEQRERVNKVASEIVDCFEAGQPDTAFEVYEEAMLNMEEKLFIWTLLPSNQRSALKKMGIAKTQKKIERMEGAQA